MDIGRAQIELICPVCGHDFEDKKEILIIDKRRFLEGFTLDDFHDIIRLKKSKGYSELINDIKLVKKDLLLLEKQLGVKEKFHNYFSLQDYKSLIRLRKNDKRYRELLHDIVSIKKEFIKLNKEVLKDSNEETE